MSRADVEELLMAVDESINSLKGYNKITKVKVKSILEHLRSSLDFIAKDINDACRCLCGCWLSFSCHKPWLMAVAFSHR